MNILQINASARRATDDQGSVSTRLANELTARLRSAHPAATVTVRDLAVTPQPVLDEAALGALFTPADQRSAEQAARVALDDALIAELQDALVETWDALGIPYASSGRPAVAKSDRIIPLLVPKSGG